jgi:hypothetical protein
VITSYKNAQGLMLELVAYINTSGRLSRREHSERRVSNVHGVWYFRDFLNASIQVGFRVFSYIYMLLM